MERHNFWWVTNFCSSAADCVAQWLGTSSTLGPATALLLGAKNDDDDDVYEYDDEASEDEGKRVLNHQLCSTAK